MANTTNTWFACCQGPHQKRTCVKHVNMHVQVRCVPVPMWRSRYSFPPPMEDLVLNRCFLSCIITLRPSLPLRFLSPSISPHPFPRSLFGQFNHGTHVPLGSPHFIRLLHSGKYSFFRVQTVSLCLCNSFPTTASHCSLPVSLSSQTKTRLAKLVCTI